MYAYEHEAPHVDITSAFVGNQTVEHLQVGSRSTVPASLTIFELAVPWHENVVIAYMARRIEAVQKIAPLVAH